MAHVTPRALANKLGYLDRKAWLASRVLIGQLAMNTAHEALLWNRRVESPSQWQEVVDYLLRRLAELVTPEGLAERPAAPATAAAADPSLLYSCRIRALGTSSGAFQTEWSGVLRIQHTGGEPHVSASLLLFSRGRRVQLRGQLGSSLELVFERTAGGKSRWAVLGWHEDVLGEYDGIEL